MYINVIILLCLLQLLRVTGKPFLCSGIYVGFYFVFGLIVGEPFLIHLLLSSIGFVWSSVYFYLLDRYSDSHWYWLILLVGLLIGTII